MFEPDTPLEKLCATALENLSKRQYTLDLPQIRHTVLLFLQSETHYAKSCTLTCQPKTQAYYFLDCTLQVFGECAQFGKNQLKITNATLRQVVVVVREYTTTNTNMSCVNYFL
eukprot:TRINITY_DN6815_c0_g1_i1.p1 TRINITY_DN6815_c0_g1~~TRINITY_DN6815_c0_g1_i1.p1  ORF type:complete len:113 (+),score=11.34 TRINITY_DN6815_c0_g1_i1:356-694(+)